MHAPLYLSCVQNRLLYKESPLGILFAMHAVNIRHVTDTSTQMNQIIIIHVGKIPSRKVKTPVGVFF